jgi:pSer/pThr/pTyr-binding forkhead associated (FHA) protein
MSSRITLVPVDPALAPTIEIDDTGLLVIGRSPKCDVRLDNRTISPRHCVVRLATDGGGGILRDLGSTNGTRLNEVRIKSEERFYHGDSIAIARLKFLVIVDP